VVGPTLQQVHEQFDIKSRNRLKKKRKGRATNRKREDKSITKKKFTRKPMPA